jgi:hypothetical protein
MLEYALGLVRFFWELLMTRLQQIETTFSTTMATKGKRPQNFHRPSFCVHFGFARRRLDALRVQAFSL